MVECRVWSKPVIGVNKGLQGSLAVGGGLVGSDIGPLTQAGLHEALDFSVGLRRVRPSADVSDAQLLAGSTELVFVACSVVGHDALDAHAQTSVVSHGLAQEEHTTRRRLVRQHLRKRDP